MREARGAKTGASLLLAALVLAMAACLTADVPLDATPQIDVALPLPNVLQVQIVSDALFKDVGPTEPELRQALEKHQADPALYSDFCVCVRARPRMEEGKE